MSVRRLASMGWSSAVAALALCDAAACSDALEVSYRGRLQVSEEPMSVVLPMLGGEPPRAVVADRDGALHILDFDGSGGCELGPVRALASYRVSGDYRLGLRVNREEGGDEVRFVDTACEQHLEPVPDAGQTALINGLVMADVGGALVAFDPWNDSQATISEQATELGPMALKRDGTPAGLWVLEDDRLVVRGFEGELIRDVAEGVEDIDIAHASDGHVVWSDGDGLFLAAADGGPATRLHDPGCSVRSELLVRRSGLRRFVSALSPCDARRLVSVVDADTDERRVVEFADDVRSYWHRAAVANDEGEAWTFYVTEVDERRRTFLARPDGESVELAVSVPTSRPTLWPFQDADFGDGFGAWLIVDDAGVLGLWRRATGFSPVAEGVDDVAASQAGWLVHHDVVDGVGTVSLLLEDETMVEVARGVPEDGLMDIAGTSGPSGAIPARTALVGTLLHDLDQGAVTLSALTSTPGELFPLAQSIEPRSLRTFQIRLRGQELAAETEAVGAIGYLHDFDAEADVGLLAVRLDDGRTFAIDEGVATFRPSDTQLRPGMLYSIEDGPRKGVWFAPQ